MAIALLMGEILYESMLLLIGGDETTRHVISGGAYQLLLKRDRWEALLADRSLLGTAIEEMLRWVSPIKNMARTATEDTVLAIASGTAHQRRRETSPAVSVGQPR